MNKSFDANGLQFAWDSSSLKIADECPRKYYYRHLEGWYRPDKSYHLLFGGWYATALEHYHKHLASGMDKEEALEAVVLEALVATWEYETVPTEEEPAKIIPGSGGPWQSPDTAKNRPNLIRSIVWYIDHFEDSDITTVILPDGKPAVEYSFALPVDDGIVLSGHMDRVVEWVGKPYVMDQKTTGTTITPRFFEQFSPDIQMSLYTFAGRAIYNLPVKGVIIDGAQIAVGFTRFERGFTFRSDEQLNEWYENTMQLIEQTRHYTRENHFPMRTSACGNYGGCEFRHVCNKSPAVRKQFLSSDMKQGPTWDPLEKR